MGKEIDNKRKHHSHELEPSLKKSKSNSERAGGEKKHHHKHKHHERKREVEKEVGGSGLSDKSVSQSDIDLFVKENEVSMEDPQEQNFQPIISMKSLKNTGLDARLEKVMEKFDKPTPIQAASWPYLFNGNDVIGVAETGSGKTFAFGVPAVDHVVKSGSKDLKVLVVSPTRELATQTYENMVELTDSVGLHCVCIYGGVSKEDQRREVRRSQCVIATPGRLLDLLEEGSVSLGNVDYLILDEADRMLEKGFEEDIKSIVGKTKAQRQTLMFTATWPREVRELASTFMDQPVKVSIGNRDELTANKHIKQIVEVIDPREKKRKLLELLDKYLSGDKRDDKILIFALYKKEASRVERDLNYSGYEVAALHGDLSQVQRTQALDNFKSGKCNLMLATDVAARGLDIPNVKVVINLTFPLTVEDYVHRIGRTGRAGKSGIAHTLFTREEKHLSGALMNVLRAANQPVPDDLLQFGSYTKKKEHSAYGAFYKDVDMSKKGKKVMFD
ncbi:DEKNAAC105309 [Brettanomyces naardenensis]|uniref:ATP-dependent RNA helicase DBP3 n=1 Tax=Brettanomyces naardenensis TaxID=13370 RepID=A0A448YTL9_BRENA|nr:DEKNAAC105309 [Brettanomyces naardenensis]